MKSRKLFALLVWLSWPGGVGAVDAIDFSRDIRPLLSDRCFQCHGPDAQLREADLRLDQRQSALQPTAAGTPAIVPGQSAASELVRRITSDDADERMPPAATHKSLSAAEIQRLVQWIDQGAKYTDHWAFVAPQRPPVPALPPGQVAHNPIDPFILARLHERGLPAMPEADRETLIRRLSLDLLGLPPRWEEVRAFVDDASPAAYERLVDRLLASPHFGERMALEWLDAARYADTNGYHLDNGRDMTRWRAWVIEAFNRNLPFDQFTIEQLAGDLLPEATVEQQIASGFNRNHMINFEGGAIPDEYHAAYIIDRVNTTGTVWLGLTVGCAQCHDHKFDPLSQREFYQLYAFFNNLPEKGLDGNQGNAAPMIELPTEAQARQLSELDQQIAAREAEPADAASDLPPRDELRQRREQLRAQISTAMVMQEMPAPRETFVLVRGQYDQRGAQVTADVPARLGALPPGAPANRLGLAQWLVSDQQPLTARVIVNRYWQQLFGIGLVRTAEDFGSQGELPTHPELLDWLACEFHEATQATVAEHRQWNVKALIKLMVMSATYRQDSQVLPAALAADPENRYLARGPRFRLSAELIRDQALAVSGLLKHRIGGPSVSPYQPAGLWTELSSRGDSSNWTAQVFQQSHGDDLYRRSMYTFWKRTCPPPQMSAFDAPDRETCAARTNTPLQALILMNDPTYIEAARKLAERVLREGGADRDERLAFLFRAVTARQPRSLEMDALRRAWEQQTARFQQAADQIDPLLAVGEAAVDPQLDRAELAAWTLLASLVLNLDETVTRR